MKILSDEKSKWIAERNGWTLAYAEGHVEGETMRRSGKVLSMYALVGIDDYARGFRAGYFERQTSAMGMKATRTAAPWMAQNAAMANGDVASDLVERRQNAVR